MKLFSFFKKTRISSPNTTSSRVFFEASEEEQMRIFKQAADGAIRDQREMVRKAKEKLAH